MNLPRSIDVRFALALAAYHRRLGTRVPDGDLGFRCPACEQPLVAREKVSERISAHFDHFDINSTCRLARFIDRTFALRSDTLERYLTPEAFRAVMRDFLARVSDDRDELDEGDARVPSPLLPRPFDRSSSASVPEPPGDDEELDILAMAEQLDRTLTARRKGSLLRSS